MDSLAKPSFIAIPMHPKSKEMITSPPTYSPISTSPSDSRSGANTPSYHRSRSFSSSNAIVASSPATPSLNASSPHIRPGSDFPVRKSVISDRTSYFTAPPDLLFQKQPIPPVIVERQLSTAERWNLTLERAIKGIVSIKATTLRSFDTESAGSYTATGFIVDRTQGIILSNRHVVNPSPTTSTAVFGNYEEITLKPIYYDPVHDFGFFKYDPSKIKFAQVEEIELCPQGAKVGLDIKVCGNDAGEKLSILGSTLARLDRAAPYYGDDAYNDFNTFYYQAASGTSGGSSGSPVLDIFGRAVALNAGGSRKSASSFYLPLDRVVRALKLIQEGKKVPRGTLQTEFVHSSYDELKRLGLPQEVERECRERNKDGTGLLSISALLPEGPGSIAGFEVGDILVECSHPAFGHRYIDNFYALWEIIDESVDEAVELTFYRGKDRKVVSVTVQDLHSITPSTFLEIGEAIVHPLSYQLARSHHLPCKGLFVATSGMFNWSNTTRNFLITGLDGKEVDSLETFIEIVYSIKDSKRVGFRYLNLGGWEDEFGIVEIDHHFFVSALFTREGGVWQRKLLTPKPSPDQSEVKTTPPLESDETWAQTLRKALVMIQCRLPYSVNGFTSASPYSGVGVLIATEPVPMIITSRATVPVSICDLRVTVGDRNIPGRVLYLGLVVVITFDPSLLASSIKPPSISNKQYKVGEELELFALDDEHQLIQKRTHISAINGIVTRQCSPPRWRISNTEGISLLDCPYSNGGVLIDPVEKSIVALWMTVGSQNSSSKNTTWKAGLNYDYYVRPIIESLQRGEEFQNRCCGWEFEHMQLASAMNLGLNEQRAQRIATIAKDIGAVARPIFVAGKLRPPTPVDSEDLKIGDVILEVDGNAIGRMADIRGLSQLETANMLILRNGEEKMVTIHPRLLPSDVTSRIVCWAGAVLHQTHNSVLEQTTPEFVRVSKREGITNPEAAVYISSIMYGSPAIGNLRPVQWILEVDGRKVRSIDEMVEIISSLKEKDENEEYVRVRLMGRKGITSVVSVRLDSKFWSAWILERKGQQWVRTELE